MATYYLKATDEQSLWEALLDAGLAEKSFDISDSKNVRPISLEPDADWAPSGAFTWLFIGTALDVVGTIYAETGNSVDVDGVMIPETVALDGYHANLVVDGVYDDELAALEAVLPIIQAPATPHRVWA